MDRGGGREMGRHVGNEGIRRSLSVFTKHYCSREERGFLRHTAMLPPKTLSFITTAVRMDAYRFLCQRLH